MDKIKNVYLGSTMGDFKIGFKTKKKKKTALNLPNSALSKYFWEI